MRTPIRMPAVEPVGTVVAASVVSVTAPVIAIPGANDDAKNRQRRSEEDRARWGWWRRVIVSRCWRAVRLNHFSAGIRTYSRPKPECEYCQCYHDNFSFHNLLSLLLVGGLNLIIGAKLLKKIRSKKDQWER